MTLQASGAISMSDLVAEFVGPTPAALSDFYRGGTYVPDTAPNAGIPTSGAIALSDFYGGVNAVTITDVTVANQFFTESNSNAWWDTNGPVTVQKTVTSVGNVTPADDGSYVYLWEFVSNVSSTGGAATFNRTDGADVTDNYSLGSVNPGDSSTIERVENWRLTVSNPNGPQNDTFQIRVTATNEGSS